MLYEHEIKIPAIELSEFTSLSTLFFNTWIDQKNQQANNENTSSQRSEVADDDERSQQSSLGEKQDSSVASEKATYTNQEVHLSGRGTLVSQARLRSASSKCIPEDHVKL